MFFNSRGISGLGTTDESDRQYTAVNEFGATESAAFDAIGDRRGCTFGKKLFDSVDVAR